MTLIEKNKKAFTADHADEHGSKVKSLPLMNTEYADFKFLIRVFSAISGKCVLNFGDLAIFLICVYPCESAVKLFVFFLISVISVNQW